MLYEDCRSTYEHCLLQDSAHIGCTQPKHRIQDNSTLTTIDSDNCCYTVLT